MGPASEVYVTGQINLNKIKINFPQTYRPNFLGPLTIQVEELSATLQQNPERNVSNCKFQSSKKST